MSRTSAPAAAGSFAHGRRGGLTPAELNEIAAHRNRDRPTPWAALARRYGRCEADIRAFADPQPLRQPVEPVRSPLSRGLEEAAELASDPNTAAYLRKLADKIQSKNEATGPDQ